MRNALAPWLTTLLAVLTLAGCSADERTAGPAPASRSAPANPAATAYDPLPWVAPGDALGRCGLLPHRVADLPLRHLVVSDGGRARMPAVTAGRGRTVVVLLHQTDGNGFCGWLPFAEEIVSRTPGVAVLAPDLCGYGEARCRPGYDFDRQVDQVRAVLDHAAGPMRATSIVLVGASMGGSLAVLAGSDPRVDAVVDLSGPDPWRHRSLPRAARALGVPILAAMAEGDGADQVTATQAVVAAAPDGSTFVPADSGHGYTLLAEPDGRPTELAHTVLDWIRVHR